MPYEHKYQHQRDWYQRNKEKMLARTNAWKKAHPEIVKQQQITYYYGLTKAEYENLLALYDGKCGICGRCKPLVIDHNHRTGAVRGLLCRSCNTAIGLFGDSLEILALAKEYLSTSR
jgi:hypothetical protein